MVNTETLFTTVPKLGKIVNVNFTFEDGSSLDLNDKMLGAWLSDYAILINIWHTIMAKTAKPDVEEDAEPEKEVTTPKNSDHALKEVFNKKKN